MSSSSQLKIPLSCKWVINNPKRSLKTYFGGLASHTFTTSKPLQSSDQVFWKLAACISREIIEVGLIDDRTSKQPSQRILISDFKYSVLDPLTDRVLFTKRVQDEVLDAENRICTSKCMLFSATQLDYYITHGALALQVSATVTEIDEKDKHKNAVVQPPPAAKSQAERPVALDSIRKELHTLYKDQVFTDVTLRCERREFKVHKIILASQSPVFKKMFEINMKESRDNFATISDIDPTVLSEMLAYIYSGEALSSHSLAADKDLPKKLLKAADMYQIPRLVTLCANEMQKRLAVHDVIEVLMHAHTHNVTELKTACLLYIQEHTSQVKKTSGWSALKENAEMYSSLLVEIMDVLAK